MRLTTTALAIVLLPFAARSELKLPAIIGDNMVLQQKQTNPVWGWDTPGSTVTVQFAGQSKSGVADGSGRWTVKIDPLPASAQPATMTIKGSSTRALKNILVGEVWLCSGQSNMGFKVGTARDADVEALGCKHPNIRLITIPHVGTQTLQDDFKGQWEACTPDSAKAFTAVGFFFGRLLHQALEVPVGLIDNSWGGSACEAWVRRDLLDKDVRFKDVMDDWRKQEAAFTPDGFQKQVDAFKKALADWNQKRAAAAKARAYFDVKPPRAPQNPMEGQHRPGNLFAGCLHPLIGYGIKGAIWYQGESNSSRAKAYRDLFPLMITHWREEWKQGDFPFYWVQLADYMAETATPGDSSWAELRESQTLTQSAIKNGGQAVIIDLGEGKDIHPTNKRDVAERLARWALARDYGMKIVHRSPEFKSAGFGDHKATVTLDMFGSSLQAFDVPVIRGFAVCGEDRKWSWAEGRITGPATVEVTSNSVAKPVAVRYAWSDNPVCNLYNREWLPVTPFRSDDFPMVTDPKNAAALQAANAAKIEALKKLDAARKANGAKKAAAAKQ